jgi:hypothetical protein
MMDRDCPRDDAANADDCPRCGAHYNEECPLTDLTPGLSLSPTTGFSAGACDLEEKECLACQ